MTAQRLNLILTVCAIAAITPVVALAADSWISVDKLDATIKFFKGDYSQVQPSANCSRPQTRVETMICRSSFLRKADLLSNIAQIYQRENATKIELDHKKFKGALPNRCRTEQCVYDVFASNTNYGLGSMSPYSEEWEEPDEKPDWALSSDASLLAYGMKESGKIASLNCGENKIVEFRAELPSPRGEKLKDGIKSRLAVSWKGGEQILEGTVREGDGYFFEASLPTSAKLVLALRQGQGLTLSRSGESVQLPPIRERALMQKFTSACSS
ncbi:hypothetical protein [Salinarimonas soli]|uniref:Uncharacterized protein n=1 Tax=Salinarimonas soli TaxID=1638099 RepID=A0A5B2VA81_9HYPH|nr:hypothetical protein [Salinarimonas soli]KAA2236423.1 hypothetical protein F0L46_14875 [Salinarimonas soli]